MAKILFVCTGNVCRSPMAEGLFRDAVGKQKGVYVASAGLSVMEGRPPSEHSMEVLKEIGVDISRQRSMQLTPQLVQQASHIFAMTQGHKEAIELVFPFAAEKTFLLREFADGAESDDAKHGLLDVPDPIGMGRDAYETTRDLIRDALPAVLEFVRDTTSADRSPD